jgi:flagellar biosynthesis GTPase FlhF
MSWVFSTYVIPYLRAPVRWLAGAKSSERKLMLEYQTRIDASSKETSDVQEQLSSVKKELEEEREKLRLANTQCTELRTMNDRSISDIKSLRTQHEQLQREKRGMQRKIDELSQRNEQLVQESMALSRYMDVHDKITETQIIESVTGLNYEIGNIASDLADAIAENAPSGLAQRLQFHESYALYSMVLSNRIMTTLDVVDHKEDPTLLSIVIQAILVEFCHRVILQWRIGNDSPQNLLDAVHDALSREGTCLYHMRY